MLATSLRRTCAFGCLALLCLLPVSASESDTADGGKITLERIMADPDWIGRAAQRPYWADDSGSFYYSQKRLGEQELDLFHAQLDGQTAVLVEDQQLGTIDQPGGSFDREHRLKSYARDGDIFVKDLKTGELRQLTRTAERESRPVFLADGRLAFERDGQTYVRDLETGLESQPFDLRFADDPIEERDKKRSERDYLASQQNRLFDWIREGEERRDRRQERRLEQQRNDPSRPHLPYYLGSKRELFRQALSPSGDLMLVVDAPKRQRGDNKAQMPRYVTDSGYVETEPVRPKVGTAPNNAHAIHLLRAADHRLVELDLSVLPGITEDPLAELRAAAKKRAAERKKKTAANTGAEAEAEADEREPPAKPGAAEGKTKNEPRSVRISDIVWNEAGTRAVFQAISSDNKDRWVVEVDLEQGELEPLHRIHDSAWINWRFRDLGWLSDGETLYLLSEESGYSQLHLIEDGKIRALTGGEYVIGSLTYPASGDHLYFTANREHPGVYEVYRVALASGEIEQLTELGGMNAYVLSPDERSLLVTHSELAHPPELYLQEARPGAKPRKLTDTTSEEFLSLPWIEPEIVEVPSAHVERPIYSRLYLPAKKSRKPRPAVVFAHGAGYLQNSHKGWSSYFREFMFHTLLVESGYVVLDMDYRASAGYGRDWRTAIYRQMGKPEIEDIADGVGYLVEHHNVDPERVGIYGGSYGGFLTFMGLFTRPELFAAGAALRPVTDWAHYNQGYTSNILNTPELDPEAYERSSPIEFAHNLNKPLLICTGMLDNNVLFQDSVRLVQRLIELEKEDWEIAIYPVEPHGFREPSSWLDEYRRIFKLFERHLKQ